MNIRRKGGLKIWKLFDSASSHAFQNVWCSFKCGSCLCIKFEVSSSVRSTLSLLLTTMDERLLRTLYREITCLRKYSYNFANHFLRSHLWFVSSQPRKTSHWFLHNRRGTRWIARSENGALRECRFFESHTFLSKRFWARIHCWMRLEECTAHF